MMQIIMKNNSTEQSSQNIFTHVEKNTTNLKLLFKKQEPVENPLKAEDSNLYSPIFLKQESPKKKKFFEEPEVSN